MQPSRRPCLWALLLLAWSPLATLTRADSLTITTSPPGATVEMNGAVAGTTPFSAKYPGGYFHKTHTAFGERLEHSMVVRISKEGYVAQQVTLTNGPFDWVAVTGRRRGNYFLIKSEHFEVKLEPVSHERSESSHTLGVEGPISPPPEALRSNDVKNSSEAGSVAIVSDPADAEIYIDGKFVGQTPATIRLTAGPHRVELKTQGRQTWERQLEVLKDSQLSLHAVLAEQH